MKTQTNQSLFRINLNPTLQSTVKALYFFDVYANHSGRGIDFNMSSINVSGGANLTFNSHIRGDSAFLKSVKI